MARRREHLSLAGASPVAPPRLSAIPICDDRETVRSSVEFTDLSTGLHVLQGPASHDVPGLRPSMRTFLTGEWRDLAMLNWVVDPALLQPFVPRGTELDTFGGRTFVSLVGFRFVNTRVLGAPVPGHRDFEEVNLRIYVRREVHGEVRRGVTFIREIVPRPMIAAVARLTYNEPYRSAPMRHLLSGGGTADAPRSAEYAWRLGRDWAGLHIGADGVGAEPAAGSEAEFITEHYWGYTRQRDGSTVEYRVEHPRWRVWTATTSRVFGDLSTVYGEELARLIAQPATSAFIADGSAVRVGWPSRM